jgi:hypothetical protein
VPSLAVHRVVSEWAVVVLIEVSGETPEWPGLARNIGQSAALAVPAIPSAPAIATPAAAMTSAGRDCGLSIDISMLLSLVVCRRVVMMSKLRIRTRIGQCSHSGLDPLDCRLEAYPHSPTQEWIF